MSGCANKEKDKGEDKGEHKDKDKEEGWVGAQIEKTKILKVSGLGNMLRTLFGC